MPSRYFPLAAGALAATLAFGAQAQTFPAKQIRFILPFPPGGPTDMLGRALAQKLAEQVGQPVVADNRPGAGGNLGLELAAKSPPDGHTVVLSSPLVSISPSLYAKLNYDPERDLAPVSLVAYIQNVIIVHPSVPAKTLREFVELARKSPGKLNFGSGGAGTTNHLANELLKHLEKVDIVHVPYKGVTQAMNAMRSGEVDEVVMPITTALGHIKSGRVRALAVLTEQRITTLPDVPTGIEAGVKGFTMPLWYGMFMPAATPRPIVERMEKELIRALQAPDIKEKLTALGVDPWPGGSDELASLLKDDIQRYGTIIKSAGLPKQ